MEEISSGFTIQWLQVFKVKYLLRSLYTHIHLEETKNLCILGLFLSVFLKIIWVLVLGCVCVYVHTRVCVYVYTSVHFFWCVDFFSTQPNIQDAEYFYTIIISPFPFHNLTHMFPCHADFNFLQTSKSVLAKMLSF